jgi:hypothetical protein
MRNGIMTELDWALIGSILANQSDEEQATFLKAFIRECKSWGTHHQIELQLAMVNAKLTDEEKELLSMIGYKEE